MSANTQNVDGSTTSFSGYLAAIVGVVGCSAILVVAVLYRKRKQMEALDNKEMFYSDENMLTPVEGITVV